MAYHGFKPAEQAIQIGDDEILSSHISDGVIVNADVNASAAIATSKVSGAVTSIGSHGLGSLATLSAVASAQITDGTIVNADVNNSAAIATSKLSGSLTSVGSHGLATSATTDTTNASNISSGTLAAARVATLNQNTTGTAATVTTAAQSAITSVGTLTSLTVGSTSINKITHNHGSTALEIENLGSKRALYVHSDVDSGQDNPLVEIKADNTGFDQEVLRVHNDGTGHSLQVLDDGSEVFSIVSGGNVGINIAAPLIKFAIAADNGPPATSGTTPVGNFRIEDVVGGNSNVVDMGTFSSSPWGGWIQSYDNTGLGTNYPLVLNPNGGSVGIGTTSPDYLLDIEAGTAEARIVSTTNASAASLWLTGRASDGNPAANICKISSIPVGSDEATRLGLFVMHNAGGDMTERLSILNGGNVGIGTTVPTGKLHITVPSDGDIGINVGTGGVASGVIVTNANMFINASYANGQGGNGVIAFGMNRQSHSGGTEVMRLLEDGTVGIGGTATSITGDAMLKVRHASNATWLHLDAASGYNSGIKLGHNNAIKWYIYSEPSSPTADRIRITDSANDHGMYINQNYDAWYALSDERMKTSLTPIENAVDKLNTLQAVNFKWKYGSSESKATNRLGLLAQEVYEVFPEVVDSSSAVDFKLIDHPSIEGEKQAEGAWALSLESLVPVLVKAVQELSAEVEKLKENA